MREKEKQSAETASGMSFVNFGRLAGTSFGEEKIRAISPPGA